ncbi:MAG: sugar ABC transporter substrate-binding protein [Candidatus Choladocola sp.]|nr:sugar ABC transporter substrate-binding protein [Candidatus Choladocola sp.]
MKKRFNSNSLKKAVAFGVAMSMFAVSAFTTLAADPVMVGTDEEINAADFDTDVTPDREYTIAVVVKSAAIPVWESHIVAAKKAGEELGVEVLDYSPSKADNVEEQKRILEDLITTGVDAVVLAPANTEAVKGPVQELIDAGIPVVYDNTMGPSDVDYLTYVGVDNTEVGVMIAEKMAETINYEGNILVMEGVPGQATSDDRTAAVIDTLKQYENITVESGVTNWQTDEGRKLTEDYITKWGDDLKGIISVGGNQAEGAVEAIAAAGLQDQIVVNGFDVQEPQYEAVENGSECFTVSQGVYYQAYLSVVAAVRALNGEDVPRKINCPITIVTQDNLAEMDERPDALQSK